MHVREKQYRIKRENDVITEERWPLMVEPGVDVAMSGLMLAWGTIQGMCPRPSCSGYGRQRGKTPFFTCNICSLMYAHDNIDPQGLVESPRGAEEFSAEEAFACYMSNFMYPYDKSEPQGLVEGTGSDNEYFRRIHVTRRKDPFSWCCIQ